MRFWSLRRGIRSGFEKLRNCSQSRSIAYVKRSDLNTRTNGSREERQVVLLDSMGELATLYALASVVFIGGSLVPTGGHNILEPALFRKPILFGPSMSNFREMSEDFLQQQAAVQVRDSAELGSELVRMFRDADFRQRWVIAPTPF